MGTLWNARRWNSFRWGGSAEFEALLNQKGGLHTHNRIIWKLDAGDQDITEFFVSGGEISREKERAPDRMTAGDMRLVFKNTTGVFTENSSDSFLNGITYHNRNVTFEVGIELSDGSIEYRKVATMKVRAIDFDTGSSTVTLTCYDLVERFLSEKINTSPISMIPVVGSGNTGDGTMTSVATKPFATVTENWTLTCNLGGGDATATFTVVGSVSGNIGTATSGDEFENSTTGGIKFTIEAGDADWIIGDTITFSTVQMMEWEATNPFKIIWSILTGTVYDTGADEDWKERTPKLDSTQSSLNTDIDYASFKKAVDDADTVLFTLKGYFTWDYSLTDALEEIIFHFLGSINIDGSGRVFVKIYIPEFDIAPRNFADTKLVTGLNYTRDMRDMINRVEIDFRKLDVWPWTDEDELESLDGRMIKENQDSFDDFNQWFSSETPFISRWYNANDDHVDYLASRLLDKYGSPPKRFSMETGLDALAHEIGDYVTLTNEKDLLETYPVEVVGKEGRYGQTPKKIMLTLEDTGTVNVAWAFLGSSANEGDGLSPQALDFDDASLNDKNFAYASQTGGSGTTGPDYLAF